jgi:hypothetical protein
LSALNVDIAVVVIPSLSNDVMAVKSPLKTLNCLSLASAHRTAATVAFALDISASSLVAANLGIAMLANIPMTTITKTSSIIVNAFFTIKLLIYNYINIITKSRSKKHNIKLNNKNKNDF